MTYYRIKVCGVSKSIRELIEFNVSHHRYTLKQMYNNPLSQLAQYIEEVER